MSEYNKFLDYFNSQKKAKGNADDPDSANAADIFGTEKLPDETEESFPAIEASEEKAPLAADNAAAPEEKKHGKPQVRPVQKEESHFIRSTGTQFVAVNASEENEAPDVKKYTDRLKPKKNGGKKHTGYTGKLNTYAANHAPETDAPKFRPLPEDAAGAKIPSKKDTPERSAVPQTRIIPEVVDPNAAQKKQPEKQPEKKKQPADFFDISSDVTAGSGKTKVLPDNSDVFEELPGSDREKPAAAADDAKTKKIDPAKSSLLRELAKTGAENDGGEDSSEQLMLDGFREHEAAVEEAKNAKEEALEEEVSRNRQKLINDFNFWSKSNKDTGKTRDSSFSLVREKTSLPEKISAFASKFEKFDGSFLSVQCDEFRDFNHRRAIFNSLIELRKKTLIRAAAVGGIGLIMLLINVITSVSAISNNGFFTVFGGNQTAYAVLNLLMLLFAAVIMADDLKSGLFSLLQARPKTDTALLLMLLCSFIQCIGCFTTQQNVEYDFHMLTGGTIFLCAPLLAAKSFYYDNIRHCFKTVTAKNEKAYLRKIGDESLVSSLLADTNNEGKNVVYAGKTRFIADFIERSRASASGGEISSRFVLIAAAASLLTGLLALIIRRNFMFGVSAMCLSSALSFPIGCAFFTGFMLSNENKALSLKSSFIQSFDDANDLVNVDNLVICAEDAFKAKITNTVCWSGADASQAAFVAAALTDSAGGILKKAFGSAAGSDHAKYPAVEDLTYEDKLGFSAWISGCKVLLGSETFLRNHNVDIPETQEQSEEKFIYLALAGHAAARFTVKYSCKYESVRRLRLLAEKGTNILLISTDPNITDVFAENLLTLPADSVRVVNRQPASAVTAEQETITDAENTGIVFTESFDTFCRCAYSALKLDSTRKLSGIICEVTSGAGLAIALLLAVSGSVRGVACWLPILVQAVWTGLCFLLPPVFSPVKAENFRISKVRPVQVGKAFTPDNYQPRQPEAAEDIFSDEEEDGNDGEEYAGEEYEDGYEDDYDDYDESGEEDGGEEIYAEETYAEEENDTVFVELPALDDYSGFSLKGKTSAPARPVRSAPVQTTLRTAGGSSRSGASGFLKNLSKSADRISESFRGIPDDDDFFDDAENSTTFRTSSRPTTGKKEPSTRTITERRSILSFADEEIPAPPKYDLGKKDDLDFLNVKFVPPVTDEPQEGNVFDDAYFSRYEGDDIFSGLKEGKDKTFKF